MGEHQYLFLVHLIKMPVQICAERQVKMLKILMG